MVGKPPGSFQIITPAVQHFTAQKGFQSYPILSSFVKAGRHPKPHFTEEETKDQGGQVFCPSSHSKLMEWQRQEHRPGLFLFSF